MLVVVGAEDCAPLAIAGAAVTIGAYDGVHLGHQRLLADLRARAGAAGAEAAVVTFDRHPATVVRPDSAPLQLTDLAQKLELLAAAGVDRTLVVPFDETRAKESPEDFVAEVLVRALGARLVVVGEDFHFGHQRRGDVSLLRRMGGELGFTVLGASLETDASGEPVSSTRIRKLLADGRVRDAASLLGRDHQVRGPVVRGDGRGGPELGYPTANVHIEPGIALPADGVYAGWYERPDGVARPAALSLGRRPTFYADDGPRLLEAHLLDFDGDLYGEPARVAFVDLLRPQLAFDAVEDLLVQMERDVADARVVLGGHA